MISTKDAKRLQGQVAELKTNTLYKLANGDFLVLFKDTHSAEPDFAVYQHTPHSSNQFTLIEHELQGMPGSFADRFKARIAQSGGRLMRASNDELKAILRDAKENHPNLEAAGKMYDAHEKAGGKIPMPPLDDPHTHITNMQRLSASDPVLLHEGTVSQLTGRPVGYNAPTARDVINAAGSEHTLDDILDARAPVTGAENTTRKLVNEAAGAAEHEHWMNKKSLIVIGGVVAIGAAVMATKKFLFSTKKPTVNEGQSL